MHKIGILALLSLMFSSQFVYAEACTYAEALKALQNNNEQRAMMLLKMASIDGDIRAIKWLNSRSSLTNKNFIEAALSSISLSINRKKTM